MDNNNRKCLSCGSEQPENAAFCGECGAKMSEGQEQNSDSLTPPVKISEDRRQYQQQYQPQMYQMYQQQNPQDAPLSMGDYLLMLIAFMVPIVGLILMIVWSVSSSANTNRKNFSRAMLIVTVAGFILSTILSIAFAAFFFSIFEQISHEYSNNPQFFDMFDMSVFRRFLPW